MISKRGWKKIHKIMTARNYRKILPFAEKKQSLILRPNFFLVLLMLLKIYRKLLVQQRLDLLLRKKKPKKRAPTPVMSGGVDDVEM